MHISAIHYVTDTLNAKQIPREKLLNTLLEYLFWFWY